MSFPVMPDDTPPDVDSRTPRFAGLPTDYFASSLPRTLIVVAILVVAFLSGVAVWPLK